MKIEIKNLTKIYPRGKKKALNGVNIEIGQGIFGLIGRNGAGKTTLMRIVATIMDATDGEIYFDGKELKANNEDTLPEWLEGLVSIFEQASIRVTKTTK